jgi:hypothetical protein
MRWDEFAATVPEIAGLAEERFKRDDLAVMGTLRADGSPRVSPNEVDFAEGHLFVSMMWRSKKALDLFRDPRCVVHSVPITRMNPGGDVKLYGRALDIGDPELRQAFRDAIMRRIDWAPDEPEFHLFSLEVESAGYTVFGKHSHALAWDPERGLRRLPLH